MPEAKLTSAWICASFQLVRREEGVMAKTSSRQETTGGQARGLTVADKAQLDAFADELLSGWEAVQGALVGMAEVALRLLDRWPELLEQRGAAYTYLAARLERRGLSRRRLYDVVCAARVRAEVRALPGPAPAFEALTVDQTLALRPVLPTERERMAAAIRSQGLSLGEIRDRLRADGIIVEHRASPFDTSFRRSVRFARMNLDDLRALPSADRTKAATALARLRERIDRALAALEG
jgi:hypothetical protein